MKKYLALFFAIFLICGFDSLSGKLDEIEIENKTKQNWETKLSGAAISAYNKQYDLELHFDLSALLPSSTWCVSNKRIRDIKFNVKVYKKMQKGDAKFARMVDRMKINFFAQGYSEEVKVYTSNLIGHHVSFNVGDTVPVGTLYFLAPFVCKDVDQMKMRITDITVQGRRVPPLEIMLKLKK